MQKLIPILCLCAALLLTACPRAMHDVKCGDGVLAIALTGFDTALVTQATVFRYAQGTTSIIDSDSTTFITHLHDTSWLQFDVFSNYRPGAFFSPGYDYQLSIPGIGKSYLLTAMQQTGITHKSLPVHDPPLHCTNDIAAVSVDGTAYPTHFSAGNSYYLGFDTLFIAK